MSTFELDIRRFSEKLEKRAKVVLQKTAMDIDRSVVLLTPVDTGQARGGWNVGVNGVNLEEADTDKSGQKTISENERSITRAEAPDTIYVSNNVGHIEYLEDGSSKQAPNGMVAKTLKRFPQFVREGVSAAKKENP